MELGNCARLATGNYGLCSTTSSLGTVSETGTNTALRYRSAMLRSFLATSSWRLLSQDSFASRHPPPIVAAKQPKSRVKKSKAPSSADIGVSDVNKSTETTPRTQTIQSPVFNDGQPVEGEVSKQRSDTTATRDDVLKACVSTSGVLAVAGLVIRQGTHWAAAGNWSIPDCPVAMPCVWQGGPLVTWGSLQMWLISCVSDGFEVWHLGATAGTVALIASFRQILLSMWPEFSESSRQSNKQVLSSLEPVDFLVVSFLPGISEELLFRGAVLPLVGVDWRGVAVSGIVFGFLHISGGRNTAFAAWASFVGVVYGLASISTSNLAVPMVAHSVANLIAACIWRLEEDGNMKERR